MRTLSRELRQRVADYVKADRQWKRYQRIKFARHMLKFAHALDDEIKNDEIIFWKTIVALNADDGYDKQWRLPRE